MILSRSLHSFCMKATLTFFSWYRLDCDPDWDQSIRITRHCICYWQCYWRSSPDTSCTLTLFFWYSLEFTSTIPDGLFDVMGQFPEILKIMPDPGGSNQFPDYTRMTSPGNGLVRYFPDLDDLSKISYTLGDAREVGKTWHLHWQTLYYSNNNNNNDSNNTL